MTISRTIWTLLFVVVLIPVAGAQDADERAKFAEEKARAIAEARLRFIKAHGGKLPGGPKALAVQIKTKEAPPADTAPSDPFGKDVKPPADTKKKVVKTAGGTADKPAPARPTVDPQLVKLYLQNGSTISGRLTIKQITVETRFGTLTIPIAKIKSITPGLGSNNQLSARVDALIEKLGSDVFADRETAEKELLSFGPPLRDALEGRLGGKSEERQRRLKKLLAALEEIVAEQDDEFAPVEPAWIERDTVETAKFTVYGNISPKSFQVESKYGLLTVKLGDIRKVSRDFGVPQVVRRRVTVDQKHIVQRGYKSSGIRVEKGDLITITAEGTLAMTPFGSGSRYISSPAGGTRFGNYNGILGGTLIAKIGSSSVLKIGRESRFVAKSTGVLQFAIAMQQGVSSPGNQFPGSYTVSIKVEKAAKK
ncbi:MAG: hypothetical protein IIA67_13185 [Planctomycetes bacterium]|nr:hypothetical protein [Planctomycetota bacterium]